jgi:hypothetical protein
MNIIHNLNDRVYPRVMVYFLTMMMIISAGTNMGWTTVVLGALLMAWFWILSLTYLRDSVD